MNIVKSNVRNRFTNSALNTLLRIKVSKVPVDFFIKITFQGVLNTGSKRKAGEWRKENANATNVENQKSQNNPILTSQPCRHLLHLNTESDIDSEVEHV